MINEKISLARVTILEAPSTSTYSERAKLLLESAQKERKGMRGVGYSDNKYFATPEGIEALIGASAEIIELNQSESSNSYIHTVMYEGHEFFTVTKEPVIYEIIASLR